MLEILQFVLSDFWHFLGCLIFWIIGCAAICNIRLVSIHIDKGHSESEEKGDDEE